MSGLISLASLSAPRSPLSAPRDSTTIPVRVRLPSGTSTRAPIAGSANSPGTE